MRQPCSSYLRLGNWKLFRFVPQNTNRLPKFLDDCHFAFNAGVDLARVLLLISIQLRFVRFRKRLDVLGLKEFRVLATRGLRMAQVLAQRKELLASDKIEHLGHAALRVKSGFSGVLTAALNEVGAVAAEWRSGYGFGWGHIVRDFQVFPATISLTTDEVTSNFSARRDWYP